MRAVSASAFAADPIGHYWLGNTAIVWCRDATTCGTFGWGQPTDADAQELTEALELAFHPALAAGFDVLMDNTAVAHVDWNAYARVFAYVRDKVAQWQPLIRKQAVVMPVNPAGAALSGIGPMLGITYPLHFAASVDDALAWLCWTPGSAGAAATAEIAAVAEEARAVPATVRRMRMWLEGALAAATIDAAAEAPAMSSIERRRSSSEGSSVDSISSSAPKSRAIVSSRSATRAGEPMTAPAKNSSAIACSSGVSVCASASSTVGSGPRRPVRLRAIARRSGAASRSASSSVGAHTQVRARIAYGAGCERDGVKLMR